MIVPRILMTCLPLFFLPICSGNALAEDGTGAAPAASFQASTPVGATTEANAPLGNFPPPPINTLTKVFVVRHAEKKDGSANPPLTKAGECRAESLARILQPSGISVVFSTKFTANDPDPLLRGKPVKRTQETINNYADSQSPKITIQYYENPTEVANLIKSKHLGKAILVAAHSGAVEQLVQKLGAGAIPAIGNEFNNLLMVAMPSNRKPSVIRMKYESWPSVLSQMDCKDTN